MEKDIKEISENFCNILNKFPEVRYAGDKVLREETEDVTVKEGIAIGKKLGGILMRYRKEVGYGRGFAAPQIGINKSVFVTFTDDKLNTFINPKIIERSSTTNYYKELCLSSGIMATDVERPEWIVMEWIDVDGSSKRERFDGFLARLYQHEEDHLRGILNLDKACNGGIGFATFDPLEEKIRESRE